VNLSSDRAALILVHVPLHEVHFFKEALHAFWVVREKPLVHVAGIPFEQDIAEVEYDGFNR